jgi:glucose/arabinose dehydrogenase
MKTVLKVALLLGLVPAAAQAQINAGELKPEPSLPFTMTQVATFSLPWRIAFLPDGRMLITEKVGPVWLVTQQGEKTPVDNVPAVLYQGQGGMLGVFLSPHYATDHSVYLTYAEPGARSRPTRHRGGQGEPRGLGGALARHAEGPRRTIRRADRVLA